MKSDFFNTICQKRSSKKCPAFLHSVPMFGGACRAYDEPTGHEQCIERAGKEVPAQRPSATLTGPRNQSP